MEKEQAVDTAAKPKAEEKKEDKVNPEKTNYYVSMWTQNTHDFRNLLNTSKGRDKFCQSLQYVANFYVTCMKSSEKYGELVKAKKIESVNKAKKFES